MENNIIRDGLSVHGDKTAFIDKEVEYSYYQLTEKIRQYSQVIADQGILPGDTTVVISDYSFESVALFLSLFEAHTIIVPVVSAQEREIENKIYEAKADWVVSIEQDRLKFTKREDETQPKHALVQELVQKQVPGLILFSSGSTGRPKAMIHNLTKLIATYQDKRPKKHRILLFLLFDHIGGLNTLFNALFAGMTIVIPTDRSPDSICELISKHKVNILPTSPTFLNMILISGAHKRLNLSSLRLITYGTEAMQESLLSRLKEEFPRVRFLQTFGTSETGIVKTTSKSSESTLLRIDDPNQEYKIVNSELWLKSKTQILGYLNYTSESFTEDGWFKTGDIVEERDDGFIRIVGRAKEVINVGGNKVLPSEVESVLLEMDLVADCLVFGEANALTGQIVVANVYPIEGTEKKTIKRKVQRFCRGRLDNYKIPVKVNIMDKIVHGQRFKKKRPT